MVVLEYHCVLSELKYDAGPILGTRLLLVGREGRAVELPRVNQNLIINLSINSKIMVHLTLTGPQHGKAGSSELASNKESGSRLYVRVSTWKSTVVFSSIACAFSTVLGRPLLQCW